MSLVNLFIFIPSYSAWPKNAHQQQFLFISKEKPYLKKFGVGEIYSCFWMASVMLTKAAFIWSKKVKSVILQNIITI